MEEIFCKICAFLDCHEWLMYVLITFSVILCIALVVVLVAATFVISCWFIFPLIIILSIDVGTLMYITESD